MIEREVRVRCMTSYGDQFQRGQIDERDELWLDASYFSELWLDASYFSEFNILEKFNQSSDLDT